MAKGLAVLRGGGELGTGIGHALAALGLRVLVVERPLPGALRLRVAFAAAAVEGAITVAGVTAVRCRDEAEVLRAWDRHEVALWTHPEPPPFAPDVLVDARMRSLSAPMTRLDEAPLVIGVGPGFVCGRDAHYVIESNRGPNLGRVLLQGSAETHTGVPGEVAGHREARLLRAPQAGVFTRSRELGDFVEPGDTVGTVAGRAVVARLAGMIRGLKLSGVEVGAGHKVGDVDPRRDRALLGLMTDKAIAVGRGAVDALRLAGLVPAEHPEEDRAACT